jgi:2-polyprenyl-3-methyl-5-hydroxy-6-metoxy-1,4-benzoquinol methylase
MTDVHEKLRGFWDLDAETYDRSPTHSASDPVEAAAWRAAMARFLPPIGASLLDVGAGTGAMSLLAAEMGYRVTALDLSPAMLAHAQRKAGERGLPLEIVVGPATDPPPGPFDAVLERHVLWTTPDPPAALRAWRAVAPTGRLVLFEGVFNRTGAMFKLRGTVAHAFRRALGVPHDHHGHYDPELLAALPLASAVSPLPMIEAVTEAGWRRVTLERLRDVEWARRIAIRPPALGWLESLPHFALVADA